MKQITPAFVILGGEHGAFGAISLFGGTLQNSDATRAHSPAAAAGTIRNLAVRLATAPGAGTSRTFTIFKNGASTGITCTVSDAGTTAQDSTNSTTVAVTDQLYLRTTKSGVPIVPTHFDFTWEFEATLAKTSMYGQGGGTLTAGDLELNGLLSGQDSWSTTTANAVWNVCPIAGTVTRVDLLLDGAPGAGTSYILTIYKNGVKQDGAGGTTDTRVTVADAAVTGVSTFSLAVAAGDTLYLEADQVNAPTARRVAWGVAFEATTDGQFTVCGVGPSASTAVTQYRPPVDSLAGSWNTDENVREVRGPLTPVTLTALYVVLSAAPGAGNDRTVTVRKNTGNTNLTLTLSGAAATTGNDSGNPRFTITDEWAIEHIPVSVPAASTIAWGLAATLVGGKGAGGGKKGGGGGVAVLRPGGALCYNVGNPGVDVVNLA